jgi:hypothetical protein
LTDDELNEAIQNIYANPPAMPVQKVDMQTSTLGAIGEPIVRGAENLALGLGAVPGTDEQLKGGFKEMIQHPIQTAGNVIGGIGDAQHQLAIKSKDALSSGDIGGGLAYGIDYLLPFLGPQLAQSGEQLNSGDVAGGVGTALAAGAQLATPGPKVKPMAVLPTAETSLLKPFSTGFKAAEEALGREAALTPLLAKEAAANTHAKRPPQPIVSYDAPVPKRFLTDHEEVNWYNTHSTPEYRRATAAHELAHFDYALKSGHPVDDLTFKVGHEMDTKPFMGEKAKRGQVSAGAITSAERHWKDQIKPSNTEEQNLAIHHSYLRHLLSAEVVERKLGATPSDIAAATGSDRMQARAYMRKVMGLSAEEAEQTRKGLLKELDKEITPAYLKRLLKASDSLVEHHWGQTEPLDGSVAKHYLDGGTHQQIAKKLAKLNRKPSPEEASKAWDNIIKQGQAAMPSVEQLLEQYYGKTKK